MKSKSEKRLEAEQRDEEYNKLSPEAKLSKLDNMFGKGKGAKKQRERLNKEITNGKSKA